MDKDALDFQAALYARQPHLEQITKELAELPEPEYPGPPCRSTKAGLGCGHGTMEHTQGTSPNQECCCCTGRANDPAHTDDCRQCQIRQGKTDDTPGAEEIARTIGTGVAEVGEMIAELSRVMARGVQDMNERFDPPRVMLNRAEKRARNRGKGTTGGNRRRFR